MRELTLEALKPRALEREDARACAFTVVREEQRREEETRKGRVRRALECRTCRTLTFKVMLVGGCGAWMEIGGGRKKLHGVERKRNAELDAELDAVGGAALTHQSWPPIQSFAHKS